MTNGSATMTMVGADDMRTPKQREHDERMKARDARKVEQKAKADDYEIDVMAALDAAEQEYGDDAVKRVDISVGVCSVILARTPALVAPVRNLRTVQRSSAAKGAAKMEASERVATHAVVWPPKGSPGDVSAVARTYPAALETICTAALVLSGAKEDEDAGK